jgi:uncharacterized protein (TIGR04255 family)
VTAVTFENPPLSEVIFSVYFDARIFPSTVFGQYLSRVEKHFSLAPKEEPPLNIMLDDSGSSEETTLAELPPLRRVIFEASDKSELIQLQQDCFFYNWRRKSENEKYPTYEGIFPNFRRELDRFVEWYRASFSEPLTIKRYGLTYINQLGAKHGCVSPSDYPTIFTHEGRTWDKFLPVPDSHVSWLKFAVSGLGHLVVGIRPARPASDSLKTDEKVIAFEFWAQSSDASRPMDAWFDEAHQYIGRAFLDLTKEDARKNWGPHEK